MQEAKPEEATVASAEEEVKEEAAPMETAPVHIAPIEAPVPEEILSEPEAPQAAEAAPVEAPLEASTHKDNVPEAAPMEEPAVLMLPSKPDLQPEAINEEEKPEDIAKHEQAQTETEETAAAVEPEQMPAAVEESAAETEVSRFHPTIQCLFRSPSLPHLRFMQCCRGASLHVFNVHAPLQRSNL